MQAFSNCLRTYSREFSSRFIIFRWYQVIAYAKCRPPAEERIHLLSQFAVSLNEPFCMTFHVIVTNSKSVSSDHSRQSLLSSLDFWTTRFQTALPGDQLLPPVACIPKYTWSINGIGSSRSTSLYRMSYMVLTFCFFNHFYIVHVDK